MLLYYDSKESKGLYGHMEQEQSSSKKISFSKQLSIIETKVIQRLHFLLVILVKVTFMGLKDCTQAYCSEFEASLISICF